jgi:YHS domain-containing protein
MIKNHHFVWFAVLGFFAAFPALAAETLNSDCPVAGKEIDPKKTAVLEVGFCCERCQGKFEKSPKEFVSKVAEAEAGKCPLTGKKVDPAVTTPAQVGFCCGKCQTKFEDDPAKYRKKLR